MKKLYILLLTLVLCACSTQPENKTTSSDVEKVSNKSEEKFIYLNSNFDKNDVYDSIVTRAEYAFDGNIESMVENSDIAVLARVIGKEDSYIDCKGCLIKTPINIEVLSTLKGEIDNNITIVQSGGVVKLRDYVEDASNEKAGYNKLSDRDLDNKFIEEYPDSYKELKYDGIYIFFLRNGDDKKVYNTMDAYSILEYTGDYNKTISTTKTLRSAKIPDQTLNESFKQDILDKTYTIQEIKNIIDTK